MLEFHSVATATHAKASATRASGGMADALASGASVLRDVGVQVPLRPPRAVHEPHEPEITNSKGFLISGFSLFGGGVVRKLTVGELRVEVPPQKKYWRGSSGDTDEGSDQSTGGSGQCDRSYDTTSTGGELETWILSETAAPRVRRSACPRVTHFEGARRAVTSSATRRTSSACAADGGPLVHSAPHSGKPSFSNRGPG